MIRYLVCELRTAWLLFELGRDRFVEVGRGLLLVGISMQNGCVVVQDGRRPVASYRYAQLQGPERYRVITIITISR